MTRIARNHLGYRIGERHHRARYPDATVRMARNMRERGDSYTCIGAVLNVPWRTVADWCQYATRWDCR